MIHSRKGVEKGGGSNERGVLIAEVGSSSERTSPGAASAPQALTPTSLIFASEVSVRTAMLANVNQALDDQIYFLIDEILEDSGSIDRI